MNNFDKRLWTEIAITFSFALIIIVVVYFGRNYHEDFKSDCMNAGGIPVDMHCINPSAVIDMEK